MKPIEKSQERLKILEKIEEYERLGLFDRDVEDDPETLPLLPDTIDYLKKTPLSELKRFLAFRSAYTFFYFERKKKHLILNEPIGTEYLKNLNGGVILCCNHFNPYDSFVMQKVFDKSKRKGRMYRIIREGNYTNFDGFYGRLMRNCDTLPLSSHPRTKAKLIHAIGERLKQGNAVLIYPEESMWWNYKKPKPYKSGAFDLAVRYKVPIVNCFITLCETELIGNDGFPVLEYTPHISEPMYASLELGKKLASEDLKNRAFAFAKSTYETVYGIKLEYSTENAHKN